MVEQIDYFLEELASSSPTPGGGSASALVGALASALACMTANLTHGDVEHYREQTDQLRTDLQKLIDEDIESFNNFMKCLKMPKSTEEEKRFRKVAIQNASKRSAEVPMEIAIKSAETLTLVHGLAQVCNPNVKSDAICSAILARASIRCAICNVLVNLKTTGDENFNNILLNRTQEIDFTTAIVEKQILEG